MIDTTHRAKIYSRSSIEIKPKKKIGLILLKPLLTKDVINKGNMTP